MATMTIGHNGNQGKFPFIWNKMSSDQQLRVQLAFIFFAVWLISQASEGMGGRKAFPFGFTVNLLLM